MKPLQKMFDILNENDNVVCATKYITDKLVLRVTRRRYKYQRGTGRIPDTLELVVNFGKPNFKEKLFIKALKKAKEPFPVKKIQLRFEKE